jgi:hypothetical protein
MAGIGLLHGVQSERADGVDAKLFEALRFVCLSHISCGLQNADCGLKTV